jgi:hypothetical protein
MSCVIDLVIPPWGRWNHQITRLVITNPQEGGSPEDEATRPAAYRLPPPEQLPEISFTDDTCSVPEMFCDEPLVLEVDPAAVLLVPVDVPVPVPVPVVLEGFDVEGFVDDGSPPL